VIYLNPAEASLPELRLDDLGAAVADHIRGRADFWRSAYTRAALLASACAALAGYAAVAIGVRPVSDRGPWLVGAVVLLIVAAAIAARLGDRVCATVCGVSACAFGATAGFVARQAAAQVFVLDRRVILLVAAGVIVPAASCAAARLPVPVFGSLAGIAGCTLAGAGLALWLQLPAVRVCAILAVLLFALTNTGMRAALRAAHLRVSQLPHTALELQEDIEPAAASEVAARAAATVRYANVLLLTSSAVWLVAIVQLARTPGSVSWVLALVFALAVLLRAQTVSLAWQRGALVTCAVAGVLVVACTRVEGAGPAVHAAALPGFAVAAVGLLASAHRVPGRRMLPIWGHLADQLELWTAVAMVPLLLQVFHAYSYFRTLIN